MAEPSTNAICTAGCFALNCWHTTSSVRSYPSMGFADHSPSFSCLAFQFSRACPISSAPTEVRLKRSTYLPRFAKWPAAFWDWPSVAACEKSRSVWIALACASCILSMLLSESRLPGKAGISPLPARSQRRQPREPLASAGTASSEPAAAATPWPATRAGTASTDPAATATPPQTTAAHLCAAVFMVAVVIVAAVAGAASREPAATATPPQIAAAHLRAPPEHASILAPAASLFEKAMPP
mmetsp:Transcript_61152/g.160754  ORF Transcript_61152/g.160754 Transcript_61152/m.160754 type:complete len:240 (+) Transcript_61152:538-1257(+)